MKLPSRQQHVRTLSTIRFYVSAATGWHKPHARYWLAACSAVRKGGNQQLIYLARSLEGLAKQLTPVIHQQQTMLHIIPGVIKEGEMPEVMRGEETQIFGAISMEPALQNAIHQGMPVLIGLPGTHAKWAVVENNTITDFRTFMTGELFDVLSRHSILGATMHPGDEPHWDAFTHGLTAAQEHHQTGLLSTLFSTRSRLLTSNLTSSSQGDYLSGLLIGHELCGLASSLLRDLPATTPIALIGSANLNSRYSQAFNHVFPTDRYTPFPMPLNRDYGESPTLPGYCPPTPGNVPMPFNTLLQKPV